jgi:hypothetical protein
MTGPIPPKPKPLDRSERNQFLIQKFIWLAQYFKVEITKGSLMVQTRKQNVVLIDNTEARREDLITTVLRAFKDMGASDEELAVERCRLDNDPEYFYEWVVCLPNWFPKWYY